MGNRDNSSANTAAADSTTTALRNDDFVALRAYVTAQDQSRFDRLPADMILLDLTHSNLRQRHIEIRFRKGDPISELRQRIYQKTGTPASYQHIQVMDSCSATCSGAGVLVEIPPGVEDHYPLAYFGIEHQGMRIHCVDLNPHSQSTGGAFEDVSLVEKYRMSEEEYDQRTNTLRHWKRQQEAKKGQENENSSESNTKHSCRGDDEDEAREHGPESVAGIVVGDRCEIQPGHRRGRIAWVGQLLPTLKGWWVGVVLDEPVGNNDGSWEEKQIFDTPGPKYGSFIRGKHVTTGDFPERDIFDSDGEDEL